MITSGTLDDYLDGPREDVQPFIPHGALRIFDVGCRQGGFGASLKTQRPDRVVWAMEPNPAAAAVAAERLDKVIVGSFPADAPTGQLFDAVTFLDVIEHLMDPWQAVREARTLLAPDGVVVAAIPNIRYFGALYPLLVHGRWDYTKTGLLDRTHLRFFTRATAVELFESNSYTIERIAPVNVAREGKEVWLLARFGRRTEEFRALHYVVVARPR